jgi:hypothetical protein
MFIEMIAAILERDLRALRREVEAFDDERDLWKTLPGITNPAGTLALHLAGNLRHFVGGQLGGTGYVRNRDAEFDRRDVPRSDVLALVDAAMAETRQTLGRLTDADLAGTYPLQVAGATLITGDFLLHLAAHLTYHLGQIDYHRRLVSRANAAIGAVSPAELSSARKPA